MTPILSMLPMNKWRKTTMMRWRSEGYTRSYVSVLGLYM